MKTLGIMMGCAMAMTWMAAADEPAGQEGGGKRPAAIRENRGGGLMGSGMGGGGDMIMLTSPMAVKALELTDAQKDQIAAIVGSTSNTIRTLHAKRQELTKNMIELWGADPLDEAAILKMSEQIEAARSEMGKVQIQQMLAARKILTPAQRQKMREMMTRRMEHKGDKRPESKQMRSRRGQDGAEKSDVAPVSPAPVVPAVPAAAQ